MMITRILGGVGDGYARVVVKKLVFMLMKKRMGEMGDGGAVKEEKDYNRGAQDATLKQTDWQGIPDDGSEDGTGDGGCGQQAGGD